MLTKEDLQALADACRPPKPPQWVGALKLLAASLALLGALWAGASYLFVTESRASTLHADMRKESAEELDSMLKVLQAINQRDAVQDVQIEAHEKRLDAVTKRGGR